MALGGTSSIVRRVRNQAPQAYLGLDPASSLTVGVLGIGYVVGNTMFEPLIGALYTEHYGPTQAANYVNTQWGKAYRKESYNNVLTPNLTPAPTSDHAASLTARFRLNSTTVQSITSFGNSADYSILLNASGSVTVSWDGYGNGGVTSLVGTTVLSVNKLYTVSVVRRYGISYNLYLNGKLEATVADTGGMTSYSWQTNGISPSYDSVAGTDLFFLATHYRALTPSEVIAIHENPYQMLKNPDRKFWVVADGGSTIISANGSSVGTSTLAAISAAIKGAAGAVTGASTVAATGRTVFNAAGSSTGASTGNAAAVSIAQSAGSASGTATLAGSGNAIWQVIGLAEGISTVSATANAVAAATTNAIGNAIGTSTANATGQSIATSAGTAYGGSNASGQGRTLAQAIAQAVGASTASGSGNAVSPAVGSSGGTSTAQGIVVIIHEAVGTSLSVSIVSGVANAIKATVGKAEGKATISGITEGGVHYTASGDKFNIMIVFAPYAITLADSLYTVKLEPKPYTINIK